MPRTYKPTGKRQYRKHDVALLELAIQEYNSTKTSLSKLAKKYNIPKTVLYRHNTFFTKKQGGQNALRLEEEEYLIKYINICSEWGYPLETIDFRYLIKEYLDQLGYTVRRFNNNMPGPDYVKCFLKRHRDKITTRLSQNIKRSRAEVSYEIIENYFIELEKSLDGIPLSNIINCDETNLTDDPGRKKVLVRRSVKYPERIMNHTKGSTSLMMAATADGTLLPPYVVYKAQYVYDTWRLNGPKGCRYNSTTSGWFDAVCFEDWIKTIVIPYCNDKPGTKILIGDNLSSHLSIHLIRECKDIHDIRFVFLPANSTHLTQPLDVAVFRPLKIKWRDILCRWKKHDGSNYATVPKQCFPMLLKKLVGALEDNISTNIKSGFQKCGISPINKYKVLERIPNYNSIESEDYKEAIDDKILSLLQEMRYGISRRTTIIKRKKKIDVIPGRSVENKEAEESNESNTEDISRSITNKPGTSKQIEKKKKMVKTNKTKYFSKELDCGNTDDADSIPGGSKIINIKNTFEKIKGKKTDNLQLVKKTKSKKEYDKDVLKENQESATFKKPYPISKDTNTKYKLETEKINNNIEHESDEFKMQNFINETQSDQEETLRNNLPAFDEIFNMPIRFEDVITTNDSGHCSKFCQEIFVDNDAVTSLENQEKNKSSKPNVNRNKIKIISEDIILDKDLKKIKNKINIKANKPSKILKLSDQLNVKKPKYYRNESEILSDLTDEDVI